MRASLGLKIVFLRSRLFCGFAVVLMGVGCSSDADSGRSAGKDVRDAISPDVSASDASDAADTADALLPDAADVDATAGLPDTAAERFVGTECYQRRLGPNDYDGRCAGNVGCTSLPVVCGSCVCDLCADEYCLATVCDDGGSEECPGSQWDKDAG